MIRYEYRGVIFLLLLGRGPCQCGCTQQSLWQPSFSVEWSSWKTRNGSFRILRLWFLNLVRVADVKGRIPDYLWALDWGCSYDEFWGRFLKILIMNNVIIDDTQKKLTLFDILSFLSLPNLNLFFREERFLTVSWPACRLRLGWVSILCSSIELA